MGLFEQACSDPGDQTMLPFGLKQAALGKEAIQEGLNTGNRLFDVVRAMVRPRMSEADERSF